MPRAKSSAPPSGRRALTHVDTSGKVRMVDVGAKPVTERSATAEAFVRVTASARRLTSKGGTKKGSPLEIARIAGIQAAKRTADLIPLCHPLALNSIDVQIAPARGGYRLTATVRVAGRTGVEMEALTAVSIAALTIYDMLKAVDRAMTIEGIRLLEKHGGRSGSYRARTGLRR